MPNFVALRAAVFPLSTKNLRGADIRPPPVGARFKYFLNSNKCLLFVSLSLQLLLHLETY